MPSIPPDWAAYLDLEKSRCDLIAGEYANFGEQDAGGVSDKSRGLLAEQVLARQLPGGRPARVVDLESDPDRNLLTAQLSGHVNRKIAIEVSCESGWHTFRFERSGNYLGDGVVEKRFVQHSYLRQDRKGRLVARVVTDAEYEARYAERSTKSTEDWFRFELVPPSDQ